MKSFFRIVVCFFLLIAAVGVNNIEAQSRKVRKAEAKEVRRKEAEKKAILVSQEKDKKRRFKMQTDDTKKRMKGTRKGAKRINDQNHQPFLKKIFHRKRKK